MIEICFHYPNVDGEGSWSFYFFPSIETHHDGFTGAQAIQVCWMFWGFTITFYRAR